VPIDGHPLEQPLDRALAAPLDAIVDFLGLLRAVNMDRRAGIDFAQAREKLFELPGATARKECGATPS
jgi:hypothetical protein